MESSDQGMVIEKSFLESKVKTVGKIVVSTFLFVLSWVVILGGLYASHFGPDWIKFSGELHPAIIFPLGFMVMGMWIGMLSVWVD